MKIIKNDDNIMLVLKENKEVNEGILHTNDKEASFEKHIPNYNIIDDKININVNHVMDQDHYIEWILVDYNDKQIIKHFKPNEDSSIVVDYSCNMTIYSYCNKHGLWVVKVE